MKRIIFILFASFIIFEIGFSFIKHYHMPLDGDMACIILPCKSYQTVHNDPFGINVLLKDSIYPATNRFFPHWFMSHYFKTAPFIFQHITNPLNSVYISSAFIKTVIQILIIYLLGIYISRKNIFWHRDFLLAAVLITPLFQTSGYNGTMGIIDKSITYDFFYALSICFVLLFFLPFFNEFYHKKGVKFKFLISVLLLLLAVPLSFNGPLNPAIILLICPFTILYNWWFNFKTEKKLPLLKRIFVSIKKTPVHLTVVLGIASILCLYSLYIGKNDSENLWTSMPLLDRYARLPKGLIKIFIQNLGLPMLSLMIIVNIIIINYHKQNAEAKKLLKLFKWIVIFSTVYTILLPLGGYREYRPNIIRFDSFMPVTLSMILFYGISSFYIIKNLQFIFRKIYYTVVIIFIFIFVNADIAIVPNNNCERNSLEKIIQSSDSIVKIENDCKIMSWGKIGDYNYTKNNGELLQYWGVTKEKKLYYQE